MLEFAIAAVLLGAALVMLYFHNRKKLRRVSVERMTTRDPDPENFDDEVVAVITPIRLRRFILVPWILGILLAAGLYYLTGLNGLFSALFGLIVAVVGTQLEGVLAAKRELLIETQLADAIDIIVGALRSGVGLVDALGHAVGEARKPLRPILEDMSGRLRLGDNPAEVFSELAFRIPLETFRLFSFTLSVHWEIGGSLAPTLATVGRTIRDRIDLSRRVKSQTMQARASVVAILLITYVLTFIVWRTNPARLESFVSSSIGQGLFAATIFLQLVGLVWMSKMSDIRY